MNANVIAVAIAVLNAMALLSSMTWLFALPLIALALSLGVPLANYRTMTLLAANVIPWAVAAWY